MRRFAETALHKYVRQNVPAGCGMEMQLITTAEASPLVISREFVVEHRPCSCCWLIVESQSFHP
jgi:hypothetical protein